MRTSKVLKFLTTLGVVLTLVGAQAAAQEIVLTWPCIWVGGDAKAAPVKEIVDAFNAANVGKIRVDIEAQPNYDAYEQKIRTSLAAGTSPGDIFTFKLNPATSEFYKSPLVMDFSKDLTGTWAKSFPAASIKQATIKGQLKSLPFEVGVTPVWYNMALLKKAGVTKVPATSAEFWAAADKLKALGISPIAQNTGGTNAYITMLWFTQIAATRGGENVWSKPITDPVFVESLKDLKKMFSYANVDSVGAAPAIANGHFLKEESAIYSNGSWRLAPSEKDGPAVFSNLAFDYLPSFGTYKNSVPMFLQAMLAAGETKDPARRAAIITFLKVLTSPDSVKKISLASGAMFTVPFTFQAATPVEKGMQRFMDLVQKASFTVPNLEVALGPAAVAEFGQLISKYVAGETTEADMLKAIAKKLED
ncbi:MAG: extracellular solute-binding protein [Spirochaetales bacterium]